MKVYRIQNTSTGKFRSNRGSHIKENKLGCVWTRLCDVTSHSNSCDLKKYGHYDLVEYELVEVDRKNITM